MKINSSIGLVAVGIALATTPGWAQTTPTGTVNPTTYPQGAIAPDSMSVNQSSRMQKRAMKRNRRAERANARTTTTNASVQDARYRESSASEGTSVNNSNVSNYNSNNVTNAPTGAGSNPNTKEALQKNADATGNSATTSTTDSNAGAVEAVKGAKAAGMPAVTAGSTTRNTSIGDFMASSPNYITLQNALQSSDLFDMLKGTGPYTLFAPTNNAFKKLPTALQGGLLDGSNREALKQLLSYHVVSGTMNTDEMTRQIKAGDGKAQLKTMAGGTLTARLDANGHIMLMDEQGGTSRVEGSSYQQSNGMVYGIDTVLMPKAGAAAFK